MGRRQQLTLGILAAMLVLLTFCFTGGLIVWNLLHRSDEPGTISESSGDLLITVLYSPEKEAWFSPLVEQFNDDRVQIAGRRVRVVAEALDSGEALEAILAGDRYPTVWSPASTVWVPLLNQRWQSENAAPDPLAIYPEPMVVSPLVIAMWEDYARAMDYPERDIGWQEIISATLDPRGWGAYGHPEWGSFKLGHTNPYFSNSGLLSVAAEGYAAAGKVRDLTPEDLAQPQARTYIEEIERAIIHYGESTEYFAQQMAARGPDYASAVVLEENTVIRLNRGEYGPLPGQQLVAIYPQEGTFWSDHPYVILRGSWVDAEQKAAALAFRDFLFSPEAQKRALEVGFRPADTSIPLTNSLIAPAHGVDPFQPQTVLEVPSAETLDALLNAWLAVRKRVNVLLVVDTSGSMEGRKLAAVQDGLKLFLDELAEDDRVSILTFNDRVSTLTPLTELGPKRRAVESAIDELFADRETVLHDVTLEALAQMTQAYDPTRINAIVLMTDGLDTASWHSQRELLRELERLASSDQPVRVFTIAYGNDADKQLLEKIADATEARMVEGTPENIRRIYVILSSYF